MSLAGAQASSAPSGTCLTTPKIPLPQPRGPNSQMEANWTLAARGPPLGQPELQEQTAGRRRPALAMYDLR